jgi:hypothetical protein
MSADPYPRFPGGSWLERFVWWSRLAREHPESLTCAAALAKLRREARLSREPDHEE